MEGADSAEVVFTRIIIVLASIEHIVMAQFGTATPVANKINSPVILDQLTNPTTLDLKLMSVGAANINLIVINAELYV